MEGISSQYIIEEQKHNLIKVIGVGGGGGNAVNHMFKKGITDVSFAICNTDIQALQRSNVPTKIQLGAGLGAGNKPEVARIAAEESHEEIKKVLDDGTKMVFITAGMGGGTGTGAAPVVAAIARELDILTIGIVTIPFAFEGPKKIRQALDGVTAMSPNVDAMLVVNNDKLRTIYPQLGLSNAFGIADDVLTNAAKGIAEIITIDGYINVDFADVSTIMRNGGVAVMNTGYAEGENRVTGAINDALNSPLLNNNEITKSKKILLSFYCSEDDEILMNEVDEINAFMNKMGDDIEVIWGITFDNSLGHKVKVTLLATGADLNIVPEEMVRDMERRKREAQAKNNNPGAEAADNSDKTGSQLEPSNLEQPKPWDNNGTSAVENWMEQLYPDTFKPTKPKVSISLEMLDDDEDMFRTMEQEPAFKRR